MENSEKLSPRKQRILQALVEDYISTGEPVSSGGIKTKYMNDISSATIRSELAALEEMGYLVQPHIASGRIPSAKAYKMYCETFVRKKPLSVKEKETINGYFETKITQMEDIVKQTAKIISDVTNYTSVIVINDVSKVKIREIKLVEIGDNLALVIIITDSGVLRDKTVTLPGNMKDGYLSTANNLVNNIFRGKFVDEIIVPDDLVNSEMDNFRDLVDKLIEVISSYSEHDRKVFLEGELKMLDYPEYNDIDSAKNFLSAVSEKENLCRLIENNEDIEFSVKIGNEQGGLENSAIVSAKYTINGKEIGQVGVIGPERMDYNKVVSVLNYMSKAVDEIVQNKICDKNKLTDDNKEERCEHGEKRK